MRFPALATRIGELTEDGHRASEPEPLVAGGSAGGYLDSHSFRNGERRR